MNWTSLMSDSLDTAAFSCWFCCRGLYWVMSQTGRLFEVRSDFTEKLNSLVGHVRAHNPMLSSVQPIVDAAVLAVFYLHEVSWGSTFPHCFSPAVLQLAALARLHREGSVPSMAKHSQWCVELGVSWVLVGLV